MKYEFTVNYRQFKPGDPVPAAWDAGTVGTMLHLHRVRPVGNDDAAESAEEKAIEAAPADKMLRPRFVKRKGLA